MSVQQNKFITPVFDTILDRAIAHAQEAAYQGDPLLIWDCLVKLVYSTGDKELLEEFDPFIANVEREVNNISRKYCYALSDILVKKQAISNYLKGKSKEFYRNLFLALDKHNYLKKGFQISSGRELGY